MPGRSANLHGNVPDKSSTALLLIDVINDLDFDGGRRLLDHALPMAGAIAALKRRARSHGVPVIYVNDNFGRWQSDLGKLLDHCLDDGCIGRPVVEMLMPDDHDYFVLKPKHSGFYSTTLAVLLDYLGVATVILTGLTTDICVLFTANDAYMRDYELVVPEDCVAAVDRDDHAHALAQIRSVLKADTTPSTRLDIKRLARRCRRG